MPTPGEPTDRHEMIVPEEGQRDAYQELLALFEAADMAPVIGEGATPPADDALAIDTSDTPPTLSIQKDGETHSFGIEDAEEELKATDAIPVPVYDSEADVPNDLEEGNVVYIDGQLFVEDGT